MQGDFRVQPEISKACGVVVLIMISYAVQAIYQDKLVSRLFVLFNDRLSHRFK